MAGMRSWPRLIGVAVMGWTASCASVPDATRQEISARDQWAQRVSPAARQQVMAEAQRHTGWGEKRKIQYEIDRFAKIYHQEQAKTRRPAATTTTTTRGAAAG